jgi:ABC-2 type transport system permease protein
VPEMAPAGRPSAAALVLGQSRYALADFWRTPVSAFFTVAFPLIWLVAVLLVTGNPVVDPETGRRLAQFLAPSAVVFAIGMACFSSMPVAVVVAREQGILKRLRGTPMPAWSYIAGRVVSAAVVCAVAVGVVMTVAVLGYGVEPVPGTALASLVTLAVGIACFTALGLAVAAVVPSAQVAQAVTPSVLVVLAFTSGMFVDADSLPRWAQLLGSVFPLEPFSSALGAQLDPYATGAGWYLADLAVMVAWTVAGAVVAVRFFSWEPRGAGAPRTAPEVGGAGRRVPRLSTSGPRPAAAALSSPARGGRPSDAHLLRVQTRYAVRELWRDRTSMFFAIGLPAVLLVLVGSLAGAGAESHGMPLAQYLAPAMAAYGIFVTAYATLPETVAVARDTGVLKRLRGSPLPFGLYLTGRVAAALLLGALTFAVLVLLAVLLFGAGVGWSHMPAIVVTLLLGTGCAAALGLVLAAVVRPAKAVPAVALGTLLPLTFISDIFVIGAEPPPWVQAVAAVFPLKHFATALAVALDPATVGSGLVPVSLAVMAVWTAGASSVAWWVFTRQARARRTGSDEPGPVRASSAA